MTTRRAPPPPVAELDWALVIVKGLVEHDDGSFYFHSLMAYRQHEADAIARGYVVRGPKVCLDNGGAPFEIEATRLTDAGRDIYRACGLERLPQGPHTTAMFWKWSVTTPAPRD